MCDIIALMLTGTETAVDIDGALEICDLALLALSVAVNTAEVDSGLNVFDAQVGPVLLITGVLLLHMGADIGSIRVFTGWETAPGRRFFVNRFNGSTTGTGGES